VKSIATPPEGAAPIASCSTSRSCGDESTVIRPVTATTVRAPVWRVSTASSLAAKAPATTLVATEHARDDRASDVVHDHRGLPRCYRLTRSSYCPHRSLRAARPRQVHSLVAVRCRCLMVLEHLLSPTPDVCPPTPVIVEGKTKPALPCPRQPSTGAEDDSTGVRGVRLITRGVCERAVPACGADGAAPMDRGAGAPAQSGVDVAQRCG
jgi:hypothetical protein